MEPTVAENQDSVLTEAVSIVKEDDHYAKTFRVFLSKSSHLPMQLKLFRDNLEVTDCLKRAKKDGNIRVLSVGTGCGDFDLLLLEFFRDYLGRSEHSTTISYTVVEPNQSFFLEFKNSVEGNPMLENVEFLWHCCTIQDFAKQHAKTQVYDLVCFIHCIYYIADLEQVMAFALDNLLAEHGTVCIMAGTPGGITTEISNSQLRDEERTENTHKTINDALSLEKTFHSFRFKESKGRHSIDVSSIFNQDFEEGGLLLDFFTHKKNFRSRPRNVIDDILKSIESSMQKDGGKFFVYDNTVLLCIIRKGAAI